MAANVMRKLLPPAQRIILHRMAVWEAFNFRPLVPDSTRLAYLHEMLAKCPIYLEAFGDPSTPRWGIKDLRGLLLYKLEIKDKDEVTRENVKDSHYKATNILNAPPRRLADWWFQLQDLVDEIEKLLDTNPDQDKETQNEVHRLIVYALGEICRSAINEDTLLPTHLRSRYRDALRLSPAGIWELVEYVDSIPDISGAYELSNLGLPEKRSNKLEHPWKDIKPDVSILINHGRGWFLRPANKWLPTPTVVDPLAPDYEFTSGVDVPRFNPDTTYALMLFHDLLGLGHEWKLMRQSVQINRPLERRAATVWPAGPASGAWISWPAPGLLSYWEYDVFVGHWNRVVDRCQYAEPGIKTIEGTLHRLVYGWIDAGVAVSMSVGPSRQCLLPLKGRTFAEQEKDWKRLAERVGELIIGSESRGDIRNALLREWIWRLAYFLMPSVSGVTKDVTKIFAEQANLKKQWADGADAITRYHQEIFDFFRDKGMNDLAAKLKDRVEDYAHAMKLSLGPFDMGPQPHAHPWARWT